MSLRLFARRLATLPSHSVVSVPRTVTAVKVSVGDKVQSGDVVAEMSTFALKAEADGIVAKMFLQQGCVQRPSISPLR